MHITFPINLPQNSPSSDPSPQSLSVSHLNLQLNMHDNTQYKISTQHTLSNFRKAMHKNIPHISFHSNYFFSNIKHATNSKAPNISTYKVFFNVLIPDTFVSFH